MEIQRHTQLLFQGAEAQILTDGETVKKFRLPKRYKHGKLDARDRTRRTRSEARILQLARERGVNVPAVLAVDEFTITMQYIKGRQLTELIREAPGGQISTNIVVGISQQLSKLHQAGIAHGDLTSSNFIINQNDDVYIVDFGLAQTGKVRDEEKAVDLYVLERSLQCMSCVQLFQDIISRYEEISVLKKLEDVEKRGRKREKEDS